MSRRGLLPRLALLLLAAAAASCDGSDPVAEDIRALERAYHGLRDAVLQGDDEAFFRLHCREARDEAVKMFPAVRAEYQALPPERKAAFREQYRVDEEAFLSGSPRDLVVRMLPWKSGWRGRAEQLRTARVKDVRIEFVDLPGGGRERRGVVVLEFEGEKDPSGAPVPESRLPTVVFRRDEDGWGRRSFFRE